MIWDMAYFTDIAVLSFAASTMAFLSSLFPSMILSFPHFESKNTNNHEA
jgi:hypothetical protein